MTDKAATLVFLYGPPAVGKLTIGEALSERTGFSLVHNHLTINVAQQVLEYGTQPYFDLVAELRLAVFKAAAGQKVNLITTFVYAPEDKEFVQNVVSAVEEEGGKVLFVRLYADSDTLLVRVLNEKRKQLQKIHNAESLLTFMQKWDLSTTIEHPNKLSINTASMSAEDAADIIENYIKSQKAKTAYSTGA